MVLVSLTLVVRFHEVKAYAVCAHQNGRAKNLRRGAATPTVALSAQPVEWLQSGRVSALIKQHQRSGWRTFHGRKNAPGG